MITMWRRINCRNSKCILFLGFIYIMAIVYETFTSKAPLNAVIYLPEYVEEADEDIGKQFDADIVQHGDTVLTKKNSNTTQTEMNLPTLQEIPEYAYISGIKYLLLWNPGVSPLTNIKEGQDSFIENNCEYFNCFVTGNRSYLKKINQFDAIVFPSRGPVNGNYSLHDLPDIRSPKQKYIYSSRESAEYYPANVGAYGDGFFNWTWTYRLSSDIHWRYFRIYDMDGNLIGPVENMKWHVEYGPVSEETKARLSHKSKAAAWFVSHCLTTSRRETFVTELNIELSKFGLRVDIFGKCGNKYCQKFSDACFKIIEKEYYFYLSFETSFDEDFVTEKLLHALQNFAIPIVYGGANYSRFLPPGSYLDALQLGPKNLSKQMNEIISNTTLYHSYFRWTNHYIYKSSEQSEICNLCKVMNNEKMVKKVTKYVNFRQWWIGASKMMVGDFITTIFIMDKSFRKLSQSHNNTEEYNRLLYAALKNRTKVSSQLKFFNDCVLRDLNETYEHNTMLPRTIDFNTMEMFNGTTTAEYDQ